MTAVDGIADRIRRLTAERHVAVVGIGGYCGSGKSALADRLPAARVRGYDFLGPVGSRRRSDGWDALHRRRAARGRDGAGMRRDTLAGCDHDALWRDVWVPTDAAFALGFDAMNSCAHWNSLRLVPPRQST